MYEIGLSINPALTSDEDYEKIKKAGIDYV